MNKSVFTILQDFCPGARVMHPDINRSFVRGGMAEWFRALDVPGSNPHPYRYLNLFSVAQSSTPQPRCVNSQLVSPVPVGILNSSCSICKIFGYLYTLYIVPN